MLDLCAQGSESYTRELASERAEGDERRDGTFRVTKIRKYEQSTAREAPKPADGSMSHPESETPTGERPQSSQHTERQAPECSDGIGSATPMEDGIPHPGPKARDDGVDRSEGCGQVSESAAEAGAALQKDEKQVCA
jgi:hypothetical protein